MTEKQHRCPLCTKTFGEQGSVKAHITRKTDDAHKGESGNDYDDEIQVVEVDDPGESSGGTTTEAVEFPDADGGGGSSDESDGTEELPCGDESFDKSEAPDPPFEVTCETCGDSWTVTEL